MIVVYSTPALIGAADSGNVSPEDYCHQQRLGCLAKLALLLVALLQLH